MAQSQQHPSGDNRFKLLDRAIAKHQSRGDALIEVLHVAQGIFGYLENDLLVYVAQALKLPLSRVVVGRERCAVAPNGAPDCLAAAETLCRKQGYSSGKSMDFTSAEQCPPRVMLGGRQTEGDCTTVTFISRAMCQ